MSKGLLIAIAVCTALLVGSATHAAPFDCPWTAVTGPIPGPIGTAPPP